MNNKIFTRISNFEKASKTQAEMAEGSLQEQNVQPPPSAAEPTALGDQSFVTTALKPTPKSSKKKQKVKSCKPTKPKKGLLEDEIPEANPVTAPKSQDTVATSSQQLSERSQPGFETPPPSSQKEVVVNTGTPNYEALGSFESIFLSPSPRAMSISAPQPSPTTSLPPTMIPLLKAIDLEQTLTSHSRQLTNEKILQQETGFDFLSFANPSAAEEDTSLRLLATCGDISSRATTTTVRSPDHQLDSGLINKTLMKATTVEDSLLSSDVGSPRNQDKGAPVFETRAQTPVHDNIGKTTKSGRSSDDLGKTSDGLKHKELTVQ